MAESLDADGLCRQSAASLAAMAGMSARGVEKILASLTGSALSQVERGGGRGKASAYRIEAASLASQNSEPGSEFKTKNPEPHSENRPENSEQGSWNQASAAQETPNHIHRMSFTECHSPNAAAFPEPHSENQPENSEPGSENRSAYKELTYLPTYQQGENGRSAGGDGLTGQPAINPAVTAFEEIFGRRTVIYEQEIIAAKVGAGNLVEWRVFLVEYKRDYPRAKNLMKALSVFEQRQAELQNLLAANGSIKPASVGRASPDSAVRRETKNTAGNAAVLDEWVADMERRYGNQ